MTDARLHVMDHPLILHKISMLRAKETNTKDFRQLIHEIAQLIGYKATRDLPVTEYTVTTPVADAVGYRLPHQVCLVPILRAGLGMVDALLSLIPAARVGHIGLSRDPVTLNRWNIIARCRRTWPSVSCLSSIRCLRPEAAPPPLFRS